jgi:hypothetical protein
METLDVRGRKGDSDGSGPLIEADYSVPLPVFVIFLGMVDVEVQTPAFSAMESTGHDQLRHGGQVSQFDEITIEADVRIVFVNLSLDLSQVVLRQSQPAVFTDDTHIVPHKSPYDVPVVGYEDHFTVVSVRGHLQRWNLGKRDFVC